MKSIRLVLTVLVAALLLNGAFGVISYAQIASAPAGQALTNPVNINKASVEELQSISGVGAVIAQRIIDYRKTNGVFQALEDIMDVQGIGQAKYERIKSQITL